MMLILLLPRPSLARDVWIELVGVNDLPTARGRNFTNFYQEAASFLAACEASRIKPECHLMLNSDWTLAREPDVVGKLGLPILPKPTRAEVWRLLSEKLQAGKAGERIILTLSGHGFVTEQANSCAHINGTEEFCETDLIEIAKLKAPGVRFVVNAEGCFGGGFVDASSRELCITSRVDRQSGAESAGGFFWDQIVKNHFSDLRTFRGSMGAAYATTPIPASESIKSIMCRKAREQSYKNWPRDKSMSQESAEYNPEDDNQPDPKSLPPDLNTTLLSDVWLLPAQPESRDLVMIESESAGFLEFLRQARSGFRCDDIGFSGELCQSLKTVLGETFQQELSELHDLTLQLRDRPGQPDSNLTERYNVKLESILKSPLGLAWQQIEPCFFNVEQAVTVEEETYRKANGPKARPLFPRVFRQQDITDAETCESGVQF